MSTIRIDIPDCRVDADRFLYPSVDIMTDTGKQKTYVFASTTRNGVINVVRYVPLDLHPNYDKPKKFDEAIEVHAEGDTVIRMRFRTVTSGDMVIEALAQDILDKSILAIRDKDGFIRLTYKNGPGRYWKSSMRGYGTEGGPTARISIVGSAADDQVPSSMAVPIMHLFDERVNVQYHTQVYDGISTTIGQIISISKILMAVSDVMAKMRVGGRMMEEVCSLATRVMHVPYDEYY